MAYRDALEMLGQEGHRSNAANPLPPSGARRQSTLEQYFKDPKRKLGDASHKKRNKRTLQDAAGQGILAPCLAKRDRSPPKLKRKNIAHPSDFADPMKSNCFPAIPADDEFLHYKRQKKEAHPKKLPEVQNNGVRKQKRVQLARLGADKTDARQISSVNNVSNRVVKSLWHPPKQMKRIAEVASFEANCPHKSVKCRKYLSLDELEAPEKVDKLCARPMSSVMKESDECTESDVTISDCILSHTEQWSMGATSKLSQPQAMQGFQTHTSLPLNARFLKQEVAMEMGVRGKSNSALQSEVRASRDFRRTIAHPEITSRPKKQKSRVPLVEVLSNGDHAGANGGPERTLTTEKSIVLATPKIEDTTSGKTRRTEDTTSDRTPNTEEITSGKTHKTQEITIGNLQGAGEDPEVTPRKKTRSMSAEEMQSGDLEGSCAVPRMTPRTRKLTDAMQNFIQQKTTLLRNWKEIELGNVHPSVLIGRSCKVYWPLDNEWYPGVIHEYNPQTRKHRIDYEDEEREWVLLGKERVKLHVSADEGKSLEMAFGEGLDRKKLDPEGLAILAAGLEDCHGEFSHGDLVWAKVKGYPMWPACVMDEEHASASGIEPTPRERTIPVQFFGSYDHARISINSKKVIPFSRGILAKYHSKCKRIVFEQGLQEVERYLKECKLPENMAQLQEEVVPVVSKKAGDLTSGDDTDDGEPEDVKDERKVATKRTAENTSTLPLELGTLRILDLGKIVRDSEQFHTDNHIWTEGYVAIRKFASMKDPEKLVDYKMEVLRNPTLPSHPLFRVTPADDKMVEDSTASGCWKKILIKIQRAKEKAGLCIASLLEKKRQSFRSGPSMFGFGHRKVSRLIQALPNVRVCSKFTAWIEKPLPEDDDEDLAPAGYQPVEFSWKHLDRCNVCYLDEEYTDNQLLQCDKCRTMVHMYCYGELEPPDGDLWLCNLCRPEAPKRPPFCCLCPVKGGAMKATTDGRWAHLTCAMWTPETCLVDVKRMEPVDGISAINKERWKLICTVCKVAYGACIQCSKPHCRVAFHPLCARAAGLAMEVVEEKDDSVPDSDSGLQLLTYCKKHKHPTAQRGPKRPESQQSVVSRNYSTYTPPRNPSGCARGEPYSAASRRGHRQPEALAAALAKRFFVENRPYIVTGCQRNVPNRQLKALGVSVSLWSWHWKQSKSSITANGDIASNEDLTDSLKTPQSMSERYRHMRSTLHQRLTFGKSAIHGWGVFTKQTHRAGDMVIEYAGEIVRPIIADIRERRSYDTLVGAGTYMFRIDDDRVVDATHAGSIGHLINHSCEPNCYSRVVAASGDDHIIIFAKRDIREGEELSYDYRFSSKDELLTCYCGTAGCRGSVNNSGSDDESTKIIASRSELTKWVV